MADAALDPGLFRPELLLWVDEKKLLKKSSLVISGRTAAKFHVRPVIAKTEGEILQTLGSNKYAGDLDCASRRMGLLRAFVAVYCAIALQHCRHLRPWPRLAAVLHT